MEAVIIAILATILLINTFGLPGGGSTDGGQQSGGQGASVSAVYVTKVGPVSYDVDGTE